MDNMTDKKLYLAEYINPTQSHMAISSQEETSKEGEKRKHWYLDGIFVQGEIENLNGRIYPRHEIEYAVQTLQNRIKAGEPVFGELDHPDSLVVNLEHASHIIESINMSGNNGTGRMKIIGTVPKGKIVEGFLSEGIPLGVSSRGSGNVDSYTNEVSDFEIITIDIVATPSAQDARPTPVYEMFNGSHGRKIIANAQDCISNNDKHTQAFNDDLIAWFKNWNYK